MGRKNRWQNDYAFRNDVVYRTEYFMNFYFDLHLGLENELFSFSLYLSLLLPLAIASCLHTYTIKASTFRARTRS